MRVLFTAWGWPTHFQPGVPLAWAFQAAGHDVLVASQPSLAAAATEAGLTMAPVGGEVDVDTLRTNPILREVRDTLRDPMVCYMREGELPQGERDKWLAMHTHFGLVAEAMVDDLVALAAAWRPDLIVWEQTTLAGAVTARVHKIPDVRLVISPDVLGDRPEAIERQTRSHDVSRLFERFGVLDGHNQARWTLDQCPPSLRLPSATHRMPMRYTPYAGGALVPDWVHTQPERPRVCLSAGLTTAGFAAQETVSLPELLEYVRELDVEVIMPGAAREFPQLAEQTPPNVRVLDYVPLSLILPSCAAIVHHGGGGTMLTAASHGVPQVVLPQILDQGINAHQITRTGAGLTVSRDQASARSVRETLDQLLSNTAFQEAADRVAQENHHQPTAAAVVDVLGRLGR
ncbi:DUF1205 domain-containing protein (plasmid) [Nocardiopsis flavescens]|uniref:LooG1 n=1 Tax=Nocardiopsis flavescens TaxID=758803 RepID=A0A6M5K854_9ACTN|nr:LooG1 [Nocardiopsis flavescens]QKW32554.1 DUF1205 domain-containing protein [Nocardiopsis flavescens]